MIAPGEKHGRVPRWLRRTAEVVGTLVLLALVIRLVLDPLANHFTRRALNDSDAIRGDFERVHVTIFPPGYEIQHLKIIEADGGDWRQPLFYAESARLTVNWRRLLRFQLAAALDLERPKIIVVHRRVAPKKPPGPLPDVGQALRQRIPARVDRIEVEGGELLFRDLTLPRHPEIWVHRIDLSVRDLATRRHLMDGRRTTVDLSGTLGRSGAVTLSASADPLAHLPTFSGKLAVRGWKVAELYDLEEPPSRLQTPTGTLDVHASFKAADGAISGGVKPELKNVEVRPTEASFGTELKAWMADGSLHLFSDKKPEGRVAATVVPIEGRLNDPDVQLWPTILGVVRNAFVEGVTAGFASLPPPVAPEKQGVLTQIKNALTKKQGPPKAQPVAPAEPKPR